ncbi:MAG: alpha/beta fold hydrolase [Polyangiales bacterium]
MTRRRSRAGAALVAAAALWALANAFVARRLTAPDRHAVEAPASPAVTAWSIASGGPRLRGWRTSAPATRAVVVFAHGYRNDRALGLPLAAPLARRGMALVTFDFRAHGESDGDRVTFGHREREDVPRVLRFARGAGLPVAWVGFSMGAAAYLLSGAEADAAVLDSPYAELGRAQRSRFGPLFTWGLPLARALVAWRVGAPLDDVRPVDRVASLARPTRFVFAERDHWVPPDAQARMRARPCARCEFVALHGAEHGGHLTPAWAENVAAWLDRALPR